MQYKIFAIALLMHSALNAAEPQPSVSLNGSKVTVTTTETSANAWQSSIHFEVELKDGGRPEFVIVAPRADARLVRTTVHPDKPPALGPDLRFVRLEVEGNSPRPEHLHVNTLGKKLLTIDLPAPAAPPAWVLPIRDLDKMVQGAFALALLAVAAGALWAGKSPLAEMGKQGWTIESWITNLGAGAGVVAALSTLLPDYEAPYKTLSAMLGVLAAVSPVLYNLTTRDKDGTGTKRGLVGFFAMSALCGGAAALGQAWIASNAVDRLGAGRIPPGALFLLQGALALVCTALLYRIVTSVRDTIVAQTIAAAKAMEAAPPVQPTFPAI